MAALLDHLAARASFACRRHGVRLDWDHDALVALIVALALISLVAVDVVVGGGVLEASLGLVVPR